MEALILEMGVGEDITDRRVRKVVKESTSSWMGFTVDFMMENGLQPTHDIVCHCITSMTNTSPRRFSKSVHYM
jgi:hypothetical protein